MAPCSAKIEREYEAAKSSAAGSLSLRPHSRQELEIKLRDKGYSESAICRALDRLQELVQLSLCNSNAQAVEACTATDHSMSVA